jgi:hypothetical protein
MATTRKAIRRRGSARASTATTGPTTSPSVPARTTSRAGRDELYGNDNNDILDSTDGLRDDIVSCGPGRDVAIVDQPDIRGDRVKHCEEVHRIAAASLTAEQYRAADAELR